MVSSKLVFLIVPYLLSAVEYNDFNKVYYAAGILVIFGRLGFEFAINKLNLRTDFLSLIVAFNIFIGFILLAIFDTKIEKIEEVLIIVLYSFFYVVANIFLFKALFRSKHKNYFIYKVSFGFFLLIGIILLTILHIKIIYVLPVAAFLWFVTCFKKDNINRSDDIKSFYKLGVSSFIINTLPGISVIIDKFIANHYFATEVANAYTFSWIMIAPMIYVGNITEHLILASNNKKGSNTLQSGVIFTIIGIICYNLLCLVILNYFSELLPASIDVEIVKMIVPYLLIGYSLYTILQNPVKAYILKFANKNIQSKLSRVYPIIALSFVTAIYCTFELLKSSSYILLIGIDFIYLFAIILVQYIVLKRYSVE
ncbi:MAG: hypothetical protein JEY94_04240 [Melioribacteraceae bacterium]|nr:hypothetical protein [Melioribacteraceae bacterium]